MSADSVSISPAEQTTAARGVPGQHARIRGFSAALSQLVGLVFVAGLIFGAVLRPVFLEGWLAGLLLLGLAPVLFLSWQRAVKIYQRHEQGAQGEEQVARLLAELSGDWQVVHGLPSGEKDFDHVLVGSSRVFSIETVNWPGAVRLEDGRLLHGRKYYAGYDLQTLSERAATLGEALGLPAEAVTPLVCIVGGRFGGRPGLQEGVWLGEIQDLKDYLLGAEKGPLQAADREKLLLKLETRIKEEMS